MIKAPQSPIETLHKLGIQDDSSLNIEVVKYSPPDEKLNAAVYEHVNRILKSKIQRSGLDCTHITGEMRALADPQHRHVIRENFQEHKKRIDLVCYLPIEHRRNAWNIWQWNRRNWGTADWRDLLDAYDLLAESEVRLFALKEREEIHYSVFFDDFVLLQSQHVPPSHMKHVWLLKSAPLTERLREQAKRIVERADRISPSVFRNLWLLLSSPATLECLLTIQMQHGVPTKKMKTRLRSLGYPPNEVLDHLIGIEFIREHDSQLTLTNAGNDFLTLWPAGS